MSTIFFGYDSKENSVVEAMRAASEALGRRPDVALARTWEDLEIDGHLVINDILDTIDQASLSVFDVTTLNDNVLFELGYAIGSDKPVMITMEHNNNEAARRFSEFALLTTTGYSPYHNSTDLASRIHQALQSPSVSLLSHLLQGEEPPADDQLFYFPSAKNDEYSRSMDQAIDRHRDLSVMRVDFEDYGSSPLAWFTEQIYMADRAIFHRTANNAPLANRVNPRMSLLAGLATGLGKKVRIAAPSELTVALDYRDLRIPYNTSKQLHRAVTDWLADWRTSPVRPHRARRHLDKELASLRFGAHVAESDSGGLDEYFVETRDYLDVVEGGTAIFTGRKGTGKTANMLQAAATLRTKPRTHVCVIKPADYELEALVDILTKRVPHHLGNFVIEGIWKYLLTTELSSSLVREGDARPAGIATSSALDRLRAELSTDHGGVDAAFSERLERLIQFMQSITGELKEGEVAKARAAISKALHGGAVAKLRPSVVEALREVDQVFILVDNLDKAWAKGADLSILSKLILGLLASSGRVTTDLSREARDRVRPLAINLTIFLRSDIFDRVRSEAREPDKIETREIEWRDPNVLARVLEDRFIYGRNGKATPEQLWHEYFVPTMHGMPSKDWILSRVQPRPRDLVYFANEAVLRASNAKHGQITEEDVEAAELRYSQFAFEALLVEGVATGVNLEPPLIYLAGEGSILTQNELHTLFSTATVDADPDHIITLLRQHGFLGIEVGPGKFDYGTTEAEVRRSGTLASKFQKQSGMPARYEIHPAYRAYLAVRDDTPTGAPGDLLPALKADLTDLPEG